MAVKIRLRAQGCTNRVVYRLVVADSRAPRDGKYIEALGWYNPYAEEVEQKISVKPDRVQHWISMGAELSDSVENLIKMVAPALISELHAKRLKRHEKRTKERQVHRQQKAGLAK